MKLQSFRRESFARTIQRGIESHTETWMYTLVGVAYLLGVWEHLPYSGGNIYSDIVSVFQNRFCYTGPCILGIPYVNNFVEYPPITGIFMWLMGILALHFPLYTPLTPPDTIHLIDTYYRFTSIFLLIPTILLVRETLKIGDILEIRQKNRRTMIYLVATPSFVFMLLLNWYVIGVYFAAFGLRKFLEGSRWTSGILLGLSAMSNLVTAVPALGMFFAGSGWRERLQFAGGIALVGLVIYAPLLVLNSFPHEYLNPSHQLMQFPFIPGNTNIISDFLTYEHNWYIEGSWMLVFLGSSDPMRHIIFPALFAYLCALIVIKGLNDRKQSVFTQHDRANHVLTMSWLFTFAFMFSTYVCTPQMNLILLPFFVLVPIAKSYQEFLAFEIVNSLVIVWGFSQPLLFMGISIVHPVQFGPIWESPVQLLVVVRSLWIGKFLIVDGLLRPRKFSRSMRREEIGSERLLA